jgi:iron complex outermembrane receptor protein
MRLQLVATHVGSYRNTAITPNQTIDSYTPVDLSVSFDMGEMGAPSFLGGVTLGLEVRNLFDVAPPYVNVAPSLNGGGGYDPSAANPIGRLMAASVRVRL